jgi:hypothetical protein
MGLTMTFEAGLRWDQVSELMFNGDPSHIYEIIDENIDEVRDMIKVSDILTRQITLVIPTLTTQQIADVNLPPWRRASA